MAEWRESTAQATDRPRNWLIRDESLLDLVRLQPATVNDFTKIRSVNERTINRYGKQLCQIIATAKQKPAIKIEGKDKVQKRSQQNEAIIDILSSMVRIRADENSLNPAILGTRKDLEKLLFNDAESVLLHGWRYTMVGKELLEFLDGKHSLSILSGKIHSSALA